MPVLDPFFKCRFWSFPNYSYLNLGVSRIDTDQPTGGANISFYISLLGSIQNSVIRLKNRGLTVIYPELT